MISYIQLSFPPLLYSSVFLCLYTIHGCLLPSAVSRLWFYLACASIALRASDQASDI